MGGVGRIAAKDPVVLCGRTSKSVEQPPTVLHVPALAKQPGFVHAFSTLALGSMRRRDGQLLTRERRDFAAVVGVDPRAIAFVGAVHGAEVVRADEPGVYEGVDGLVTERPGLALFASYADCYPIVLYDPRQRAAGLVHAGWRGTLGGVAASAVRAMENEFGSRPAELLAGIGPGICGACYEVGPEVAKRFPEAVRRSHGDGRWLLDLAEANRWQLEAAGVRRARIQIHGACTRETSYLPSHRRSPDGARFGCLVALKT
jgi:YfiH family protein